MYIPIELAKLINIFLILVLILFILTGYKKGFLLQFLDFIGLVISLFLAWVFAPAFGKMFVLLPKDFSPYQNTILADLFYQQVNGIAWFIVLFLVFYLLIFFIKLIAKTIGAIPVIKQINSILGVAFAFVRLLILSFVVIFILSTPLFKNGDAIISGSWLAPIQKYTMNTISFIAEPLSENQFIQSFIENVDQATPEDVQELIQWLQDQGVDSETIQLFLIEIGK